MNHLKLHPTSCTGYKIFLELIYRNVCNNRFPDECYYDTLKLRPSCSSKEIKKAFFKLSMQCHPDRNQASTESHLQFIKINEAYNILSRPETRWQYDAALKRWTGSGKWEIHTNAPGKKVWHDGTMWHMRDKAEDAAYEAQPYYGIRGLKKVSNTCILFGCLVLVSVGTCIKVLVIRHLVMSGCKLDENSKKNLDMYGRVREQAIENGNHRQIQLLRELLKVNTAVDEQVISEKVEC